MRLWLAITAAAMCATGVLTAQNGPGRAAMQNGPGQTATAQEMPGQERSMQNTPVQNESAQNMPGRNQSLQGRPMQKMTVQAERLRIPEEDDILAKILSPDSPYFYPPMMIRYMEGDTTLTDEHYFYLYYGYAYDADYDAHRELPGQSVIARIFTREGGPPTREEALAIIEAGEQNMAADPFSPGNINMMIFAQELVGDTLGARINADRFRKIVRAITSSGTGQREKSPWHILRFTHANDIVAAHGLKVAERTVRTRDVEYIQVERNHAGVKGYFFNFGRIYWKPYEGERVKKKKKWMFNGYPLG